MLKDRIITGTLPTWAHDRSSPWIYMGYVVRRIKHEYMFDMYQNFVDSHYVSGERWDADFYDEGIVLWLLKGIN